MNKTNPKIIKKFQTTDGIEAYLVNDLPENLIVELLKHSANDELVRQNTSDARRFANREAFDKWLQKKRSPYVLTDKDEKDLLGFYWFGFRPLSGEKMKLNDEYKDLKIEDFNITLAYRLYEGLRGKRMFTKTFLTALEHFKNSSFYLDKKKDRQVKFWLETNTTNENSIRGMQRLGFDIVGTNYENDRVFMVEGS